MQEDTNVRDKSNHITNAGHKAAYHRPIEVASVQRGGLVDGWTDTVSSHDAPDEEEDSSWRDYGLEGERVAAK